VTCRKSINITVHIWPQRASALCSLPGLTSIGGTSFFSCRCMWLRWAIGKPPRRVTCSAWSFRAAVPLQPLLAGFYICQGGTSATSKGNPACRCSQPGLAPPCQLAVHPPGSSPIPFAHPGHFYFSKKKKNQKTNNNPSTASTEDV